MSRVQTHSTTLMRPHVNNSDATALRSNEAQKIFRSLFNNDSPPPIVISRYCLALSQSNISKSSDSGPVENAIHQFSDLEALEFAARLNHQLTGLSYRFRVMVAIAECEPSLRNHFVSNDNQHFLGGLTMFLHIVRASCKLFKGMILLLMCRLQSKAIR